MTQTYRDFNVDIHHYPCNFLMPLHSNLTLTQSAEHSHRERLYAVSFVPILNLAKEPLFSTRSNVSSSTSVLALKALAR